MLYWGPLGQLETVVGKHYLQCVFFIKIGGLLGEGVDLRS